MPRRLRLALVIAIVAAFAALMFLVLSVGFPWLMTQPLLVQLAVYGGLGGAVLYSERRDRGSWVNVRDAIIDSKWFPVAYWLIGLPLVIMLLLAVAAVAVRLPALVLLVVLPLGSVAFVYDEHRRTNSWRKALLEPGRIALDGFAITITVAGVITWAGQPFIDTYCRNAQLADPVCHDLPTSLIATTFGLWLATLICVPVAWRRRSSRVRADERAKADAVSAEALAHRLAEIDGELLSVKSRMVGWGQSKSSYSQSRASWLTSRPGLAVANGRVRRSRPSWDVSSAGADLRRSALTRYEPTQRRLLESPRCRGR